MEKSNGSLWRPFIISLVVAVFGLVAVFGAVQAEYSSRVDAQQRVVAELTPVSAQERQLFAQHLLAMSITKESGVNDSLRKIARTGSLDNAIEQPMSWRQRWLIGGLTVLVVMIVVMPLMHYRQRRS